MSLIATLNGNISINSGKMLFIDPDYLKDFKYKSRFCDPPYLGQHRDYLIFSNIEGDGDFPVIKKNNRIYMLFAYPMKVYEDGHFDFVKEKVGGEYLGDSYVDTAEQVIIDASKVSIQDDVDSSNYCIAQVDNGIYSCRFSKKMHRLIVKRRS